MFAMLADYKLTFVLAAPLLGLIGGIAALIARVIKGSDAAEALLTGLETFLTTAMGALIAFLFVRVMVWLGDDTHAAAVFVGALFLIWPLILNVVWAGLVVILELPYGALLFNPERLAYFAFAVGAFTGFFDGYRRIHNWRKGIGFVTFLSETTWGLPLAPNAVLMHLINFPKLFKVSAPVAGQVWMQALHQNIPRAGAHIYLTGVRLKEGYAFTQGNVISNLWLDRGPPIARGIEEHERTHILQNRVFGPFFWVSYVTWLIFFGAVGLIWSVVAGENRRHANGSALEPGSRAPFWWGYLNNPWEVWAYKHNPTGRMTDNPTAPTGYNDTTLSWPVAVVVTLMILSFTPLAALLLIHAGTVWFS
ncbi:MAG: hypothetical protein Q8M31_01760 [Beijerinckiaceae bacterium]|nr:hypothetical protein [Beijerinckiaceae bacterium]